MGSKNDIKAEGLLGFLREHPFIVISISIFLCTCVGYWSEYLLMQNFGIDIAVYAEVDDFLLAAFRHPLIFALAFPFFAVGIGLIVRQINTLYRIRTGIEKKENEVRSEQAKLDKSKEEVEQQVRQARSKYMQDYGYKQTALGFFFFFCFLAGTLAPFYAASNVIDEQVEKIRCGKGKYTLVELRSSRFLLPAENQNLRFITATEKFLFLYLQKEGQEGETIVIPASSVISISHIPFGSTSQIIHSSYIKPNEVSSNVEVNVDLDDSKYAGLQSGLEKLELQIEEFGSRDLRYLTIANLNLRSGNGREFSIITVLPEASEVKLIGKTGIWFLIRELKQDRIGWVHSRYLKAFEDPQTKMVASN